MAAASEKVMSSVVAWKANCLPASAVPRVVPLASVMVQPEAVVTVYQEPFTSVLVMAKIES